MEAEAPRCHDCDEIALYRVPAVYTGLELSAGIHSLKEPVLGYWSGDVEMAVCAGGRSGS